MHSVLFCSTQSLHSLEFNAIDIYCIVFVVIALYSTAFWTGSKYQMEYAVEQCRSKEHMLYATYSDLLVRNDADTEKGREWRQEHVADRACSGR